jgi:hypothetical protein
MVYDKEEKEYVQATDAEGNNLWTFQAMGANKALELLGKDLGMFTERREISGPAGDPIRIIEVELTG